MMFQSYKGLLLGENAIYSKLKYCSVPFDGNCVEFLILMLLPNKDMTKHLQVYSNAAVTS